MNLPPFPVDDATLDLLEAALNPREHGDPDAESSSVWPLLTFMSQMAGSDTNAVEEVLDDGSDGGASIVTMRDPHYHDHDVLTSLIAEVRRLRSGTCGGSWREIIRDMRTAGWRHSVKWVDVGRDADGAPLSEGVLEHTWRRSAESINVYAHPDGGALSGYLSYWPDLDNGDPDGVSVSVGFARTAGPDWLRRLMQLCAILPSIPSESRSNPT